MEIISLLTLAIATATASPVPQRDPIIGPTPPDLLSIVSFSYETDCTGGVTISTGVWSNTTNHCSPISGANKSVITAEVNFINTDCESKFTLNWPTYTPCTYYPCALFRSLFLISPTFVWCTKGFFSMLTKSKSTSL
jgi:hypothetical protein